MRQQTPAASDGLFGGRPLQLVRLSGAGLEIVDDEFEHFQKELLASSADAVAVVSVMGAFRTGKSFLLNVLLRYLRYLEACSGGVPEAVASPRPASRESGQPYQPPAWWSWPAGGEFMAGAAGDAAPSGFSFRGGMRHVTQGVWAWSRPFVLTLSGRRVAIVLLDTQGAWGMEMTTEQSATVFGLSALLSSRQVYNVNMQIEEHKVDNLAYFMSVAQAALRNAENQANNGEHAQNELPKPFQSLDFLVRDWRNFEDEWSSRQCIQQMQEHGQTFLGREAVSQEGAHGPPPEKRRRPNEEPEQASTDPSTAETLVSMYDYVGCFCLPHPGRAVERTTWSGRLSDVDHDFVRFLDEYVRGVFSNHLSTKTLLGAELSPQTFPFVFRTFVEAFRHTAPAALPFIEAMRAATTLVARDKARRRYAEKMDEVLEQCPQGMDPAALESEHVRLVLEIRGHFDREAVVLGSEADREATWQSVSQHLSVLWERTYQADNRKRLEQALVGLVDIVLVAVLLFVLDKLSDFVCDWWSKTCRDASFIFFVLYFVLFSFVGYRTWFLYNTRGRLPTVTAVVQLCTEVGSRALSLGQDMSRLQFHDLPELGRKAVRCIVASVTTAGAQAHREHAD